jgi:hypothetical protein
MKKLALVLVFLMVVSISVFAEETIKDLSSNLQVNRETQMMTYTYVTKEEINPQDFLSMKILKAKAIGEFSYTLQNLFDIESVKFSQVEYSYEKKKVIMNFNFKDFYRLNLQ